MSKIVKERVADTRTLVIIGYSYPRFNKEIDKQILESMSSLKTIVIQDCTEVACQEIEKNIRSLIDSSYITFEYRTDVSKFHVPYEYDGYAKNEVMF